MDLRKKREHDAEEAAKSEAERKKAFCRVLSERRASKEARRQEEEERAILSARRDADAVASREYAKSAARRAKSERSRQKAKVQEVLVDLARMQHERLEEDDAKATDLQ